MRGTLVTGGFTLLSRLLGMLRDAATAALLGMSAGGVMDAFVFAFRLPDVARRMFGEGSLSISFIPVFAKLRAKNPARAWQLVSVVLFWVFLLLTGFVLLGEAICWLALLFFEPTSKVYLAAHLMALMLPYLILICMAAIGAATLQTLGHFSVAAMVPIVLNIIWLFGALVLAPMLADDPAGRCYLLAVCVLVAGVVQFAIQLPALRYYGWRFRLNFTAVSKEVRTIGRNALPTIIGLMTIQLNLLVGSVIAWGFSGPPGIPIRWLGRMVEYPLHAGAVSAIYFSERLFEFPQGMIGMAVATAIYPLLSMHAARKDFQALSDDLSLAARLQFILGIPAGMGLMLLSGRLAHLLYQRGAFTQVDTMRTADMIFWFGPGVWAFCMIPLLVRGFYAVGDIRTPPRVGLLCMLLNLLLCLLLIWPFREIGIAIAASAAAAIQAIWLIFLYSRRHGHLRFRWMVSSLLRALTAALTMSLAVGMTMMALPGSDSISDLIHILVGGLVGMIVYAIAYRALGGRELGILLRGREREKKPKRKSRRR